MITIALLLSNQELKWNHVVVAIILDIANMAIGFGLAGL